MAFAEGDDIQFEGHHIVIDDPEGEYWEGAVVDRARAGMLRGRGVIMLPYEPRLAKMSAVGGYFRRGWGAGIPLDQGPKFHSPMILLVLQALPRVHWCARLIPDPREKMFPREHVKETMGRSDSKLRLGLDSSQGYSNSGGGVSPIGVMVAQIKDLPVEPDAQGGWTVYGECRLSVPRDGFAEFALYGVAPGFAVSWSAITQTA